MKEEKALIADRPTAAPEGDPRRLAYMVAWRDRYITRLEEQLQGREEENRLLSALLRVALTAVVGGDEGVAVTERDGESRLFIARELMQRELRFASSAVVDEPEGYYIRFLPALREEGADEGSDGQT